MKIKKGVTPIKNTALIIFIVFYMLGCSKKNSQQQGSGLSPKAGTTEGMAEIPAGEFIFGIDTMNASDAPFVSSRIEGADAKPKQKVYLDRYFIDLYEVTYKDFHSYIPEHTYPEGVDTHPVIYVTWEQAYSYCRWMGKKLPTEEEWEKAARGTDGRRYTWGNEFDVKKANLGKKLLPVGSIKTDISVYGVYDMVGNVSEWTASWYKPYKGSTYKSKDFGETYKVSRGGSYNDTGHYFLSIFSQLVFRYYNLPNEAGMDNGFRCAKDAV